MFEALPLWILNVFLFAFGAALGSFLNVVIYRLPRAESFVHPPSHCFSCGARLGVV
ncbi:MAG: prepilin peptidase, partial [Armatimonadetes bacterium]|nr:prepilin peptidase [Armatimonadota bacterium]